MTTKSSPFRNHALVRIGIAESVSNIGNWITMMAIYSLVVFRGEGSILESSGLYLAGLLPLFIFSPVAGWLSDRYDRKKIMIASQLLSAASLIGLVFVEQLQWIYLLLALQAVFISWMSPARQSAIPALVSKDELTQTNAFLQQLNGLIKIFAPILAGMVLTVLDPHRAILLDIAAIGISALILRGLPALPASTRAQAEQPLADAGRKRAGGENILSTLRQLPGLQILFVITFLSISVIIGFDILAPVYIRDVLQGSEQLFSLLISLIGVGTLAATAVLMLRKRATNPWQDVLAGMFLLALIPATMAFSQSVYNVEQARIIVLAATVVGGFGNGLLVVQSATLLQQLTPSTFLGRAGGLYQSTAVAGQLVGMLLTPLLVPGLMGMGDYFLVLFIALSLVVLAAVVLLSRTRLMIQLPED